MAFSFTPRPDYTIHTNIGPNTNVVYDQLGRPYLHQRNVQVSTTHYQPPSYYQQPQPQQTFRSTMNPTVTFVSNQTFGLNGGFPHSPHQTVHLSLW